MKEIILVVLFAVIFAGGMLLFRKYGSLILLANLHLRAAFAVEDLIFVYRFVTVMKRMRRKGILISLLFFSAAAIGCLFNPVFLVAMACGYFFQLLLLRKQLSFKKPDITYSVIATIKPYALYSEDDVEEALERYFIAVLTNRNIQSGQSFADPFPDEADWPE